MGQSLVLVPTIDTYVEWHYIDHFSANKCQHFEETGRTLWSALVPSNKLKGFPSVPCGVRLIVLERKNTGFLSHSGRETAERFDESDESEDGVFLPLFFS